MIFKQQNKIQPNFSPAAMGSLVLLLFVFVGLVYMANTPNGVKIVLAHTNPGAQSFSQSDVKEIVINKEGTLIMDGKIVDKDHLPLQNENVLNGIKNRLIVVKASDSIPYKKLTDALKNISTNKNQVFLLTQHP